MKLPKLVDNWKTVLRRSWSVWLAIVSTVAGLIEINHTNIIAFLPFVKPYITDDQAGLVATVTAALVLIARILQQGSLAVDKLLKEIAPEEHKGAK